MRLFILLLLIACPLAAQPEIGLERGGDPIPDGGSDEVENTGTSPFNLTYTIVNSGSTDLNLTGTPAVVVSNEDNCTVSLLAAPATPVAAAGSTTFILQVSPLSAAKFSFDASIANDDISENPYTFTFNGNPSAPPSGGDGDGGGGSGGCSSDESRGWPALLLLACGLGAALRMRPRD